MNRALLYLGLVLLKGKAIHFCRNLRRPTSLLGFMAVASVLGLLFYYRNHEIVGQLVRRESLLGGALLMLSGGLFKGFLQRGLVFERPDVEFLFTSPFTQRQLVLYRLFPSYLFALVQGAVFFALLAAHLKHPWVTTLCFTLFQIACFHIETGAAIFAGGLSESAHYRIRWMLLELYAFITAVYLHTAWDLKVVPSFLAAPVAQLLFYPAISLSALGTLPALRPWFSQSALLSHQFWSSVAYVGAFGFGAAASLWLLLRLKANLFETSLATTMRVADRRLRLQQGRQAAPVERARWRSVPLPKLRLFGGVGAVIWKNLVVARRSTRELALALAFTLVYTGFLIALLWVYNDLVAKGGSTSTEDVEHFNEAIGSLLAFLAFFLQRTLSFDFRRDGHHLVGFRTLPVTPLALALAQITVPAALCLAFQAVGLVALMIYGHVRWTSLAVMLLAYPAIALALNSVWNLHYLRSAAKRASGAAHSASAVGTLAIVALSFMVFYPAGWTAVQVGRHFNERIGVPLGVATWLAVQYAVDFLLIVALAKLFHRFEVSRDSQ